MSTPSLKAWSMSAQGLDQNDHTNHISHLTLYTRVMSQSLYGSHTCPQSKFPDKNSSFGNFTYPAQNPFLQNITYPTQNPSGHFTTYLEYWRFILYTTCIQANMFM